MAITILRTSAFVLHISQESEICLFTVRDYKIKEFYSLMIVKEWDKCSNQGLITGVTNWFDSAEQLIDYIKVVQPNRLSVDLQYHIVNVFVRVRKGGERFAKIGSIKLVKQVITPRIQLNWVYQECCVQESLTNHQISSLVHVLSSAFSSISPQLQKYEIVNQDSSHDLQKLLEHVDLMFAVMRDKMQMEYKQLAQKYQQHARQHRSKLSQIEQLVQAAQGSYKQGLGKNVSIKQLKSVSIYKQTKPQIYGTTKELTDELANSHFSKVLKHIINTDSPNFSYFRIENTRIILTKSSLCDNSVMFTYRHRITDTITYSFKILKLTRRMGFGLVDQTHCHKIRCSSKDCLIKYTTNGSYFYLNCLPRAGEKLKQGETITVNADLKKGTIEWTSGSILIYQSVQNILANTDILWVPYIELSAKGDCIEWVPVNDSSYE